MRGSGFERSRTRVVARAMGGVLVLAAMVGAGGAGAEQKQRGGAEEVFSGSTGNDSEIRKTLPITKPTNDEERVVMSLGPGELPPSLLQGDRLRATAELQLSTTCVDDSRRCIGRPYRYSPKMTAHLVLTNARRKTGGQQISTNDSKRCHQPRPHRNHHCVLVLKDGARDVGDPANLPCPPDACFVNVVAKAQSRHARRGNVVVVGADTPDGRVRQDKGRIDQVTLRGNGVSDEVGRTERIVQREVPVGDSGQSGLRVIYSLPLRGLRKGDAVVADARQTMKTHHLPYPVYVGTQLVVSGHRRDPNPGRRPRRIVRLGAQVTEGNGFNCTRGDSAYESPCVTRKVGLAQVKRDAVDRRGRPIKLYLNLVANTLPKRAHAGGGADAIALHKGFLRAARFRDPQ